MIELPGTFPQHETATSDDPAACLRAIAERADRRAFVTLFMQFAPKVKAQLMRMGMPASRADELAQEAMLTVWRKAASYDAQAGSPAAWIFTIARNLRIDAVRRERNPAAAADPLADMPPPATADALFDTAQRSQRLRAAIASLPDEQAEVLRLSFYEDRPHAEIERALGIPLGTVKSRLRLAMGRLRAMLKEMQ